MMHLLGAGYLGFISGAGFAIVALSALRAGRREDQRASDRQADGARGEVEGVPVHAPENTDAPA